MSRSWIIDGRGLSRKLRNVTCQIEDSGAMLECPYCHHTIDNSDVSESWPGLPEGVKFDPSDVNLLDHLAAKCGVGNSQPHLFLDDFIPTLQGDEGICYTHPENLPGARKDGSSIHFFYRTQNAYATGHRKRRKIQEGLIREAVRWHKTGKTKTLLKDGVPKGYKKIMVLYSSSKNRRKADKLNWVMHQYHLGAEEDEKQGEYVVCKIFYQQPKRTTNVETASVLAQVDDIVVGDEETEFSELTRQDEYATLAGESQTIEEKGISNSFYFDIAQDDQIRDGQDYIPLSGESQGIELKFEFPGGPSMSELKFEFPSKAIGNTDQSFDGECNMACSLADLENLELDSPPDNADLIITPQDSLLDWWDKP